MFRYISQAYNWLLGRDPATDLMAASNYAFAGGTASIEAFSDPTRLPATQAAALIDAVVAARPDADLLRETLSVRFIKERGIDMYGSSIQDKLTSAPDLPDRDPATLYVSPYARPTAGACGMLVAKDAKGETHVALVKNWIDPNDHSKGVQPFWRFPGGYLDARQPHDPAQRQFDANLDHTICREIAEELGVNLAHLKADIKQVAIRSDSGATRKSPTHAIDAFYVIDTGDAMPAIHAGDDVAQTSWVRLRDIIQQENSAIVQTNGKAEPFHSDHVAFLETGCDVLRHGRQHTGTSAVPHTRRIQEQAATRSAGVTLH